MTSTKPTATRLRSLLQAQAENDSPDIAKARCQFHRISADGIMLVHPGSTYQQLVPEQVERAKAYLATLRATKRPCIDSYELKHRAEHDGYVSNGALICAAISLGLPVKAAGGDFDLNPNCLIGVSCKYA